MHNLISNGTVDLIWTNQYINEGIMMQQQQPQSPPVLNVKDNGMEMSSFNQYHQLANNEAPFVYHPEPLLPPSSTTLTVFSNGEMVFGFLLQISLIDERN